MHSAVVLLALAVPPPPADLAAWLAEADRASPAILAARARADAAGEVAAQRAALPDPLVSLEYVNDGVSELTLGTSDMTTLSLGFEQEVPHRDARRGAAGVAEADATRARVFADNLRLVLRARLIALHAELWRRDREAEILRDARASAAALAEATGARYASGEGIQAELLRAQAEVLGIDLAVEEAARARRSVEIAVGLALGRDGDVALGPATALPDGALPDEVETLAGEAAAEAPDVRVARADERRAAAAVDDAQAQSRISWSWNAAYLNRGDLDPLVAGGIGLRLPLRRAQRQDRAHAEAASALDAAGREREQTELDARARVRDLASEVASLEVRIGLLRDGIVPQRRAAVEAAEIAFSTGRAPLALAFDAISRWLDDERAAVGLEAARVAALAELEARTGRSLLHIPESERSP